MSLVQRFVIGIDIKGYSLRNARQQEALQQDLDRILARAAEAVGMNRESWERESTGDGEIDVLPADVDLLVVVRRFVTELDSLLNDHNEDHVPDANIRLRVAMHSGVLPSRGALGYPGPTFIVLQRLLDSTPVRTALDNAPTANLAQIISRSVYEDVVVPELGGLRPNQFRRERVDIPAKNFHQPAYLYVPNVVPPTPVIPAPKPMFPLPQRKDPPKPRQVKPEPELPEPKPEPLPLTRRVRDLTREIRESLACEKIELADELTTYALLESAGRRDNGWLREVDGPWIPHTLLTELDAAWQEHSEGAWGFAAQRRCVNDLTLKKRHEFRTLSVRVGWRVEEEEILPEYAEFTRRHSPGTPFYPTLRNPAREEHMTWHDEWLSTVVSVHIQLTTWER